METMQTNPNESMQNSIEELKQLERKNLRLNRIKLICLALTTAACVLICVMLLVNIGKITKNIDDLSAVMTEAGSNINTVAQDLQKLDFKALGESVETFATTGAETVDQIRSSTQGLETLIEQISNAMKNLQSINIEQLNDSIQEMHDVLEPLSKFFKAFQ